MAFLSTEALEQLSQKSDNEGRYLNLSKLEEGTKNRFRFLGKGVVGVQAWTVEGKPVRWATKPAEIPENIKCEEGKSPTQRFLASAVYDYQEKSVRFAVITQRTVQDAISSYMSLAVGDDTDSANPYKDPSCLEKGWDFHVIRTGKSSNTTYQFMAYPPKSASDPVKAAWEAVKDTIDPVRLFSGEDVFISQN